MLNCTETSQAKKTAGIAVVYRAGDRRNVWNMSGHVRFETGTNGNQDYRPRL